MRTTTAALDTAAGDTKGYTPIAKLVYYNPHETVASFDFNLPYTPTDDPGILEEPRPETVFYKNVAPNRHCTLITNDDGTLTAMANTSATERIIRQGATALQSIAGCRAGGVSGTIFYLASDGNLKRATVNMNNWASNEDMITAQENVAAFTEVGGAVVALSDTQVAVFYPDEGGVRFKYYKKNGSWIEYASPRRLFSPENLFTTAYHVINCGACIHLNHVRFYISDIFRGNVYTISFDLENLSWGDIHEAVQSDLSDTRVVNAVSDNDHVHLSVQFARKEEWDTGLVYNLLLHSHTGRYFTMHRFTYFSKLGHRMHVVRGQTTAFTALLNFSSLNRLKTISLHGFGGNGMGMDIDKSAQTITSYQIIRIENSNNDETTLALMDRDDSLYGAIIRGARIELQMGYKTSSGDTYVVYSTLRVNRVRKSRIDAKAPLIVEATAEASFYIRDLSSPFYGEIIGKTSKYDSCEDLSNLYVAPNSGSITNSVTVDFWNSIGFDNDGDVTVTPVEITLNGGPDVTTAGDDHKVGFRTEKITTNAKLNGSPKVLSGGSFEVKLYGWCATTLAGTPTDTVTCIALIKSGEDGDEILVTGTLSSAHAKFPKNYNGTAAGSYPIVWDVDAAEDDEVMWIGFIFENTTGETTFLCECVEINNVSAVLVNTISNTPWAQVESEIEETVSELEVPSAGEPFVMFSAVPYNPFNCHVLADFYVTGEGGDQGQTEFGLCLLAEDAANMIFCRYIIQTDTWEIVKLRGGVETVLASITHNIDLDKKVMFEHRDGEFAVYAEDEYSFEDPILTYSWEEADGPICTHEFNWHVGVRAGVLPYKFRIAGFNIGDAEGIPLMGNYPTTDLTALDASGKVIIDGTIYKYTGKTPISRPVGPYQGRSTYDWTLAEPHDNGNGEMLGWAHDMRWYAPEKDPDDKEGYFCAAQNGHTWLIEQTEWDAWTRTAGVIVQLRNRSRHFCLQAHGDMIGSSHRVCISPGLTGITLHEGNGGMHSYGSWCYAMIDHTIRIRTFRASDGLHDTTVKNMLARTVEQCGSKATFPGDLTWTTLAFTAGNEQQLYP